MLKLRDVLMPVLCGLLVVLADVLLFPAPLLVFPAIMISFLIISRGAKKIADEVVANRIATLRAGALFVSFLLGYPIFSSFVDASVRKNAYRFMEEKNKECKIKVCEPGVSAGEYLGYRFSYHVTHPDPEGKLDDSNFLIYQQFGLRRILVNAKSGEERYLD